MGNAIDRLAVELMRLPAKDWERLVELRRASQPDETGIDFGTRATNLPEAFGAAASSGLKEGAGISRPRSCSADTTATKLEERND